MKTFFKKIEICWRKWIIYPALRMIIKNKTVTDKIDINSIKKILILRNDRIGDMIVTTPILKLLKKNKPDIFIGIVASKTNYEIIKCNPYVDRIYIYQAAIWKLWSIIKEIRKESYDVVINFVFTDMTIRSLFTNISSPRAIKIGTGNKRYEFYYNKFIELERYKKPMVEFLFSIIQEAFDIKHIEDNLKYEIYSDDISEKIYASFLEKNKIFTRQNRKEGYHPYVLFNISANGKNRRLSALQVLKISHLLASLNQFKTIVLHAPDDSEMISIKNKLIRESEIISYPEKGTASLLEISLLVKGAMAVITPDTSIVHFAGASSTPVLGFYTPIADIPEWFPYNVKHRVVLADKGQPVSMIPINKIVQCVEEFIGTILKSN